MHAEIVHILIIDGKSLNILPSLTITQVKTITYEKSLFVKYLGDTPYIRVLDYFIACITLSQRKSWVRVASQIAQIINMIANGIDERRVQVNSIPCESFGV